MDARAKALDAEFVQQRWLAWHVAALLRADKLPSLEEFTAHPKTPENECPSPDELLRKAQIINFNLRASAHERKNSQA